MSTTQGTEFAAYTRPVDTNNGTHWVYATNGTITKQFLRAHQPGSQYTGGGNPELVGKPVSALRGMGFRRVRSENTLRDILLHESEALRGLHSIEDAEEKTEPIREDVSTVAELYAILDQHGGDSNNDFNGLPYGEDTDDSCIGRATCSDGVLINFYAPTAQSAHAICEQMFD